MECIRHIVDSGLLDKLNLPRHMRNRKVEVIIMPVQELSVAKKKPVDDLIGILHEYARPELISMEKSAWAKAMEGKYADR